MRDIETCGDNLVVMGRLSGAGIPLTDCPFTYQQNIGNVSGMITHHIRATISKSLWLRTDEMAFIYAWLMRNKEGSKYFSVVHSAVTARTWMIQSLVHSLSSRNGLNKTKHDELVANMEALEEFFECNLDLFEKKFIIYEYNKVNVHWQSFVAVNAGLILSGFSHDDTGSAGFFVLDSMSYKSAEKTVSGLKDGWLDRYNDDSGFKYFLNMAYCYLIACNNSKGSDFRWAVVSTPFGNLDGTQSDDFPQFYLSLPSFIA